MAGRFLDLLGTTLTKIQIGLGAAGLSLKVAAGKMRARNVGDTADAPIVGSVIAASGDALQLNEDAAGAGADWLYTLQRPATGMTAPVVLTLPAALGSPNQALVDDGTGTGKLAWTTVAAGADKVVTDTTALAFGSGATVNMFNMPANAVVERVQVIIDTPWNGAPTLSVGIAGTTSKYLGSGQVDLTAAAKTVFEVVPGEPSVGGVEALIATYAAGGATAGAGRIEVDYVVPS